MKGRAVFSGAILCIFLLVDFGTTHSTYRVREEETTTNLNYEVVTISQPVVETVVTTTEYESSTTSLEPVTIVEEIDTNFIGGDSSLTYIEYVNQPVVETVVTTTEYETVSVQPVVETVVTTTEYETVSVQPVVETVITTTECETVSVQPVVETVITTTEYETVSVQPVVETVVTTTEYESSTVSVQPVVETVVTTTEYESSTVSVQPVVETVVTTTEYESSTVSVQPVVETVVTTTEYESSTVSVQPVVETVVTTTEYESSTVSVQPVVETVVTTTEYESSTVSVQPVVETKEFDIVEVPKTVIVRRGLVDDKTVGLTREETIRITYQQQITETDDEYFRRICEVNIGEDDAAYLDRLLIIIKYYPHLRLWYDVKYLTYSERFYKLYYCQEVDELETVYYTRVLKREIFESDEEFESKIVIIRSLFPSLPVWYSYDYVEYTKSFYTLYYTQRTYETIEQYYERLLTQLQYEDAVLYYKRVIVLRNLFPSLSVWYDVKYLAYSEQFYKLYYSQEVDELETVYYTRVLKREIFESDEEYESKIVIIRSLFPSLPVWYSYDYVEYTKSFYTLYYTQRTSETIEQYYERLLTQLPYEDSVLYYKRVIVLRNLFPSLSVWYDVKYLTYSEQFYKLYLSQEVDELETVYYTRVLKREIFESDEEYESKIVIIRSLFPSLPVWYSYDYVEYTKSFYTLYYTQRTYETIEQYYERLLTQLPYEDAVLYYKRVIVLRNLFPSLSVWYDVKYLTYSEQFYKLYYSQEVDELETVYYTRVLKREIFESDEEYESKIVIIRSLFPSLPVWYSYDYVEYTKSFYTLYYTQRTYETIEQYYERLLTQLPYEDAVLYYKRVIVLRNLFPSLSVWYDVKYLSYSEQFYKLYLSQEVDELETVYYTRVLKREIFESDEEYESKIVIIRSLFPSLPVWYSYDYVEYTKSFYTLYYTQRTYETIEQYYERLLTQLPYEDAVLYYKRVIVLRNLFPSLSVWYDVKYLSYSEQFYKLYYSQEVDELETVYYTRVLKREIFESDEEYESKIVIIRSLFPSLPVWYSYDYVEYTKSFYTLYYTQRTYETIDQYCERLFTQLSYEDDDLYYQRIIVLRKVLLNFPSFYDLKYLIYTEKFYKLYYAQQVDEIETDYYARLLKRLDNENDIDYVTRIQFIETIYPNLKVWANRKYLIYTEDYYRIVFAKQSTESYKEWRARLRALKTNYTPKVYSRILRIIKTLFPDFAIKRTTAQNVIIYRRGYNDDVKWAANLRKQTSSSSSSSSTSNYEVASSSSSCD